MTNNEILWEAINKAIKSGWKEGEAHRNLIVIYSRQLGKTTLISHYYRSLIFSHEFAKAFWGDRLMVQEDIIQNEEYLLSTDCPEYVWQYYLQQMILEKEPLKYLEKFL